VNLAYSHPIGISESTKVVGILTLSLTKVKKKETNRIQPVCDSFAI
jgi:hypothetical protein